MNNGKPIPEEQWPDYWNTSSSGLLEVWTVTGIYSKDNNIWHRTDGPAATYRNKAKYWYLNGLDYKFKSYCLALNLKDEEISILILKYGDNI